MRLLLKIPGGGDIYCYSEFHAPCGAIIRQLLKITDTYEDIQNLKIQNNA